VNENLEINKKILMLDNFNFPTLSSHEIMNTSYKNKNDNFYNHHAKKNETKKVLIHTYSTLAKNNAMRKILRNKMN